MKKAFTLIEILVVIVIVGILAAITSGSYTVYLHKAKALKAQTDLLQISNAIVLARVNNEKFLWEITGSGCSDCSCRDASYGWGLGPLHELPNPDSDECFTQWRQSLRKIEIAAGITLPGIDLDPWGNPYLLDENEGEGGVCVHDTLMSPGPDGERKEWYHNEDNIIQVVPTRSRCDP